MSKKQKNEAKEKKELHKPTVVTDKGDPDRICQGDIIRNVEYIESVDEENGVITTTKIVFPLVIVLSQECDLMWDREARKKRMDNPSYVYQDKVLMSILLAPIYNIYHVYDGDQLSNFNIKMRAFERESTEGRNLRNNETPRYHCLASEDMVLVQPSVIDFKHYFSANVTYLEKKKKDGDFVCHVSQPYREDICIRFASFLSRIGLPEIGLSRKCESENEDYQQSGK